MTKFSGIDFEPGWGGGVNELEEWTMDIAQPKGSHKVALGHGLGAWQWHS